MSLTRVSIDRVTLPQAMLPLAKQQMRVDFDEDDRIIVHKLALAINLFENITGFGVSEAVWQWDAGVVADDGALLPVMRVSTWTAKDPTNVNITANYTVNGTGYAESIEPQYITGPAASTVSVTAQLTTGFATLDDMPPTITDVVLRIAAYLYEWREVQNIPGIDGTPYANSLITQWWIPRA